MKVSKKIDLIFKKSSLVISACGDSAPLRTKVLDEFSGQKGLNPLLL